MACARYGPAVLGLLEDGTVLLNPPACSAFVGLGDLVRRVRLEAADPRLLALLSIPRGCVTTYKLMAEVLGTGPRAVGRLLASNPLPVILPCHRVVSSGGGLGGYMGGVEAKRALLKHEAALCGPSPCRVVRPGPVEDPEEAVRASLGL